jgi:hypothetical protein
MKRLVILRGHPKKMGHNAMMTEPAQAVVSLDSWLLVLGSVIGSEAKNLKYFPGTSDRKYEKYYSCIHCIFKIFNAYLINSWKIITNFCS